MTRRRKRRKSQGQNTFPTDIRLSLHYRKQQQTNPKHTFRIVFIQWSAYIVGLHAGLFVHYHSFTTVKMNIHAVLGIGQLSFSLHSGWIMNIMHVVTASEMVPSDPCIPVVSFVYPPHLQGINYGGSEGISLLRLDYEEVVRLSWGSLLLSCELAFDGRQMSHCELFCEHRSRW